MDITEKLEVIKEFSHNAWDELDDANHYIELACKWKNSNIADMYIGIANQELSHFENFIDSASNFAESLDDDDPVRFVWKWQKEDLMDRKMVIKSKLSMH